MYWTHAQVSCQFYFFYSRPWSNTARIYLSSNILQIYFKKNYLRFDLNIFSDLSERQLIKRFFGIFFSFWCFCKHSSGSKAHMLNFSLICLVILNMIHSIILSTLSLEAGICVLFLLKHAEKKREKRQKLCRGGCFGYFLLEILHHNFFLWWYVKLIWTSIW